MPEKTELEIIKYFLTDKINTLERNINQQLADIKDLISNHMEHCDGNMKDHTDRIKELEEHKNKIIGMVIGISAIAGFISAIVILLLDKIWR